MDDRKISPSQHDPAEGIGSDAATIVRSADVNNEPVVHSRDQIGPMAADCVGQSSLPVCCGNAQRVSEGVAIALRTRGDESDFFRGEFALSGIVSRTEDH